MADTVVPEVDLDTVSANITRWHARFRRAGVQVRPHVKGHRCVEIARLQQAAGAKGIAVYTAREGHRYVDAGWSDIVIAHPWPHPWRWPRYAALARRARLAVHVDGAGMVDGLGRAAVAAGVRLGVRIVLDTGIGLPGVCPSDVAPLARHVMDTPGVLLDGVTGYAGLVDADAAAERVALGRRTAQMLVEVAGRIRAEGLPCPVVAASGTPTAEGALTVPGITEMCAGAYALHDAGLADLGVCGMQDVAVSIRAGDAAVLEGTANPWSAPNEVSRPLSDGMLAPAHICPLVQRVRELQIVAAGREVARWRTVYEPDVTDDGA